MASNPTPPDPFLQCTKTLTIAKKRASHTQTHASIYSTHIHTCTQREFSFPQTPVQNGSNPDRFDSYAYVFRRHMSHLRLAYPDMTCGGDKPQGSYNSYVFVFVPHMCPSRIPLSFIRCAMFLTGVTKAQACGAVESVA